jgi:membrane protein required for colicin V production
MRRVLLFQDPPPPPIAPEPTNEFVQQLSAINWVDHTALGVLLVFFVLGLFKGLIWQVSRIAILAAAYVVAGRFGHDVAAMLATPAPNADGSVAPIGETTLYLAYLLLFVAVLVVLSLITLLIQKLASKAGLSFFDRLGGGVLGVATGACVVLFGLFVVHMFFRDSNLAHAAERSHCLRLGKRAIDWLGPKVPDDLRAVFALVPLQPAPQPPASDEPPPLPGTTPKPPGGDAADPKRR